MTDAADDAPPIFISYSRSDGRAFAEDFEARLRSAGLTAWRDLKDVEGGEDIRAQALRAIETARHLVLILTPRAIASDWVKREWTHARAQGVKVSPILADPDLQKRDLPRWIRRADVYDIEEPERWERLVAVLKGPGGTRRVPYMAGALPPSYVPRDAEFDALKAKLLSETAGGPVALTTALQGAGGYGKTTLANALCRDDDVRAEFSDGIVRIEIGKERPEVLSLVVDVIEKLAPDGRRPGFENPDVAAEQLAEVIGEARLLLVIDDVWREAQLKPFLRGGPNCVRLVTTRRRDALPPAAQTIDVDEMRAEEAVALLSWELPVDAGSSAAVAGLAKRLEHWPQMMEIANGWLRGRLRDGEPLDRALRRFTKRLEKRGLKGFDPTDEVERNRAIGACVAASLEDLSPEDLARFEELAVVPEDEAVPIDIVEALWERTGGFDEDDADELLRRLRDASLLQGLDLAARTLRLHDNMVWLLRERMGEARLRQAHRATADALLDRAAGDWNALPAEEAYAWRFLVMHLRLAGDAPAAEALLLDFDWMRAKLRKRGLQEVRAAYAPPWESRALSLVGRAISMAAPALSKRPGELSRQLAVRLFGIDEPIMAPLLARAEAEADMDRAPKARRPDLSPPGAEMLRLFGHEGWVWSAAFSPDGARVVTASDDNTARLWDAATGEEIRVLRGHEGWVRSAAFSPDGARVVTASDDDTARLWDAATGEEIRVLRGHESWVQSAAFSPDGARVVTASVDRTARLWDAATGEEIRVLRGHEGGVRSAAFSPDGARVVTASDDDTARLWDAATGEEIRVLRGHEDWVRSAAFSPDGARVVTASLDRTARLWDAATGEEIRVLRGHESWVQSAAFSPDGARVVTASVDSTARLWDAATGEEIRVLRGHEGGVESAAFSPDGARVVTASDDNTARLWDAATGEEIRVLRGHEGGVLSVAFSPDGARVVTASHDSTARLWDAATGEEIRVLRGHEGWVRSAAFSPDGARVVTASGDRTARLWDAATGEEIRVLRGHEGEVQSAAFSPDGARVVTASDDNTARLWDAATGEEIRVLRGHEGGVLSAAFSPDGARVVTASLDRTARLWDAATGEEIRVLRGHEGGVRSAAFSPDGARVVTASDDFTARLWDAATGEEIRVLRGHEGGVLSAAFSPDGARVVTASDDGAARLWDAATGEEIRVLRGHTDWVRSAAFSPDGARVVTASGDRTARLWDAATGGEIACWTLDAAVTALALHGNVVVLGERLGGVHIYDLGDFDRRPAS